jgi:hypothetical protein
MSNAKLTDVRCPVCGEDVSAPCTVRRGAKGSYWQPDDPDDIDFELDDFEFNCDCRARIAEHAPVSSEAIVTKPARPISISESGYVLYSTPEYKRDDRDFIVFRRFQPLLEAYDKTLDSLANESAYDYDFYDGPEHDY